LTAPLERGILIERTTLKEVLLQYLTDNMKEELLAFAAANPSKMAVVVYPENTAQGWDYMPYSAVAEAYEQREEMYDSGDYEEDSIMVINLWKLEENNK
jgi:shikimate kinase